MSPYTEVKNSQGSDWVQQSSLDRKETEQSWYLGHTLWSLYKGLLSAGNRAVPPVTEGILYLVIKRSSCLLILCCPVLT